MGVSQAPGEPERWLTEVRRGGTKLAILQLIRQQDRYGYEIVDLLAKHREGALALAEGNVYPALHGLEREGTIASYWREMEPGTPPRKYYRITPQGILLHDRMIVAWKTYTGALDTLLNGGTTK